MGRPMCYSVQIQVYTDVFSMIIDYQDSLDNGFLSIIEIKMLPGAQGKSGFRSDFISCNRGTEKFSGLLFWKFEFRLKPRMDSVHDVV